MAASDNWEHDQVEAIRIRKLSHAMLHVQCDWGQAEEIKEFFSFYVPGYKFMPAYKRRIWDGKIRLFDSNRGELPAGLISHLVKFIETRDGNDDPLLQAEILHYEIKVVNENEFSSLFPII